MKKTVKKTTKKSTTAKKETKPHSKVKRVLLSYRSLPQKKQYLEFFTALLSIPVLITVIILNLNSLNTIKKATMSPTPIPNGRFIVPSIVITTTTNQGTTNPTIKACKKDIGPVDIADPKEKETVSDNPVAVVINYEDESYCDVVWSYRINNGRWSEYDNKSVALYNLPNGNVKFELKVKSLAADKEKTVTRNFIYLGNNDENASNSAN